MKIKLEKTDTIIEVGTNTTFKGDNREEIIENLNELFNDMVEVENMLDNEKPISEIKETIEVYTQGYSNCIDTKDLQKLRAEWSVKLDEERNTKLVGSLLETPTKVEEKTR